MGAKRMQDELKRQVVDLLDQHRIMTLATNRPDGWPQATSVGYWNNGLIIYCIIARDGQKYANLMADPRVSIAIVNDDPHPLLIKGLSLAGRAVATDDASDFARVMTFLLQHHPEARVMDPPDRDAMQLIRITPEIMSVLDYSRGFGHTEVVRVSDFDIVQFTQTYRFQCGDHPLH
jgi:general stress protein 26